MAMEKAAQKWAIAEMLKAQEGYNDYLLSVGRPQETLIPESVTTFFTYSEGYRCPDGHESKDMCIDALPPAPLLVVRGESSGGQRLEAHKSLTNASLNDLLGELAPYLSEA